MTESNMITFSNLEDSEDKVSTGDSVVTSNISDKYLPPILGQNGMKGKEP